MGGHLNSFRFPEMLKTLGGRNSAVNGKKGSVEVGTSVAEGERDGAEVTVGEGPLVEVDVDVEPESHGGDWDFEFELGFESISMRIVEANATIACAHSKVNFQSSSVFALPLPNIKSEPNPILPAAAWLTASPISYAAKAALKYGLAYDGSPWKVRSGCREMIRENDVNEDASKA